MNQAAAAASGEPLFQVCVCEEQRGEETLCPLVRESAAGHLGIAALPYSSSSASSSSSVSASPFNSTSPHSHTYTHRHTGVGVLVVVVVVGFPGTHVLKTGSNLPKGIKEGEKKSKLVWI